MEDVSASAQSIEKMWLIKNELPKIFSFAKGFMRGAIFSEFV